MGGLIISRYDQKEGLISGTPFAIGGSSPNRSSLIIIGLHKMGPQESQRSQWFITCFSPQYFPTTHHLRFLVYSPWCIIFQ